MRILTNCHWLMTGGSVICHNDGPLSIRPDDMRGRTWSLANQSSVD